MPDRPVYLESEFFGREAVIRELRAATTPGVLSVAPADNPVVVCGPPGVGKTSLLLRLVNDALDQPLGALYADFKIMESGSLSAFLWQLAKAIMASMEQQGLETPRIEKRMLVLNPRLVFRQRFWNPLLSKAQTTPLLLIWDNFDSLSSHSRANQNLPSLRAYLYDLLQTSAPMRLLVAITGRVEAVGEDALSPFRLKNSHRLANLGQEQTLQLIQKSEGLAVFGPVADFIFGLTSGHPSDTQRLCHSLFERQVARNHSQLAIADVIAVLREALAPNDFVGPVHQRLDKAFAIDSWSARDDFVPR